MMTIREYKRAESLEEAWQLNQKRNNRVIGGMIWLKMENINVGTAIDLSGLGLDKIEETAEGFSVGAMVPCGRSSSTRGSMPTRTALCGNLCATLWVCSCATLPPWAAAFTAALAFPMF